MSQELYYTPPAQEIFDEMKAACIARWKEYDDEHGYATQRVARIDHIQNIGDNFMYMMAMFDASNRFIVLHKVSPAAQQAFDERMPDTCAMCHKSKKDIVVTMGNDVCNDCVSSLPW